MLRALSTAVGPSLGLPQRLGELARAAAYHTSFETPLINSAAPPEQAAAPPARQLPAGPHGKGDAPQLCAPPQKRVRGAVPGGSAWGGEGEERVCVACV